MIKKNEEEVGRILKKIDIFLMDFVWLNYIKCVIDLGRLIRSSMYIVCGNMREWVYVNV